MVLVVFLCGALPGSFVPRSRDPERIFRLPRISGKGATSGRAGSASGRSGLLSAGMIGFLRACETILGHLKTKGCTKRLLAATLPANSRLKLVPACPAGLPELATNQVEQGGWMGQGKGLRRFPTENDW